MSPSHRCAIACFLFANIVGALDDGLSNVTAHANLLEQESQTSGVRPVAFSWAKTSDDELLLVGRPGQGLAFCATPKVASTLWKVLLQRINANPEWEQMSNTPHYEIIPKFGHGLGYGLERRRWDKQDGDGGPILLDDKGWKKVVFFKDPLERLLSGYLDKCTKAPSWERVWSCHGPWIAEDRQPTFQEFTEYVFAKDPHDLGLHFRPQAIFCGLDVPGNLDKFDLATDMDGMHDGTMKLLESMGLSAYAENWPSGNMFHRGNAKGHATNAQGLLSQYYTPAIRRAAENFYAESYNMLRKIQLARGSDSQAKTEL